MSFTVRRTLPSAVLVTLLASMILAAGVASAKDVGTICALSYDAAPDGTLAGTAIPPAATLVSFDVETALTPGDEILIQFPAGTLFATSLAATDFTLRQTTNPTDAACGLGKSDGTATSPESIAVAGSGTEQPTLRLAIDPQSLTAGGPDGKSGAGRIILATTSAALDKITHPASESMGDLRVETQKAGGSVVNTGPSVLVEFTMPEPEPTPSPEPSPAPEPTPSTPSEEPSPAPEPTPAPDEPTSTTEPVPTEEASPEMEPTPTPEAPLPSPAVEPVADSEPDDLVAPTLEPEIVSVPVPTLEEPATTLVPEEDSAIPPAEPVAEPTTTQEPDANSPPAPMVTFIESDATVQETPQTVYELTLTEGVPGAVFELDTGLVTGGDADVLERLVVQLASTLPPELSNFTLQIRTEFASPLLQAGEVDVPDLRARAGAAVDTVLFVHVTAPNHTSTRRPRSVAPTTAAKADVRSWTSLPAGTRTAAATGTPNGPPTSGVASGFGGSSMLVSGFGAANATTIGSAATDVTEGWVQPQAEQGHWGGRVIAMLGSGSATRTKLLNSNNLWRALPSARDRRLRLQRCSEGPAPSEAADPRATTKFLSRSPRFDRMARSAPAASFYHAGARALQEKFDTRRLADREVEVIVANEIHPDYAPFIESRDMFFLSTVGPDGQPTCSYKGGDPGFIRVVDSKTLAWPNYDGNGMYLSMGNIKETAKVGLLFIDFEHPNRMRVHGEATLHFDDPLLAEFPEAQFIVRLHVTQVFPNCPRYIHRMKLEKRSDFVPREACATPVPGWKRAPWASDVLAKNDPARGT